MDDVLSIWQNAPKPEELSKAIMQDIKSRQQMDPKSAIIDPVNSAYMGGVRDKPTRIPYSTLRNMAKIPAISAIIKTRLNQVARYSRRPRFDGDLGFRIGLKDKEAKMSDEQKKKAHDMEEFFLKTGWQKNRIRKDNFNQFLRKITKDTLEIDAMAIEKVPTLKNEVAEVWAVDSATIELVINNPTGDIDFDVPVYEPVTKRGAKDRGKVAYVQKVNGVVSAEYTEDELAYAIRNPQTDLNYVDFGRSELEDLIEIVTGILNSIRYNTTYFTQNHLPQGVLEIVGKYDDRVLEGFKRHWQNLTRGAGGKWSVPVMALEEGQGLKFTPFKNSNKDMEFNEFLEFLFNIACAVYQIDPNEVGFKSWTSGSGMTQSDNTEAKMNSSQDKGFIPLMNFLSDTFNSEIVDLIDDEFVFEWVGVDEEDEDKRLERQEKQINMGTKTVAMIWKENDVDIDAIKKDSGGELPSWALAPANAQLIQVFMADKNAEMQQGQQEQEQANGQAQNEQDQATSDDAHKKQLEIMDKQHTQNMEAKQADQQHQTGIEKMKQQNALQIAKAKPQPKPSNLKKSLTDDDFEVVLEWEDY